MAFPVDELSRETGSSFWTCGIGVYPQSQMFSFILKRGHFARRHVLNYPNVSPFYLASRSCKSGLFSDCTFLNRFVIAKNIISCLSIIAQPFTFKMCES